MQVVYIGHPAALYAGDPASLVTALAQNPTALGGWSVAARSYDKKAAMSVRDFCAPIYAEPGPSVLLQPLQEKLIADIRLRLGGRVPVVAVEVADGEALLAQVQAAIAGFLDGEPRIPIDVVVALLLLRKLEKEYMWAGKDKGYMWADNLPKGRGVDECYEPRVGAVTRILLQHELLIEKTSNSKRKVALNPERREQIYELLRARSLPQATLAVLSRRPGDESVRALDLLSDYDAPDPSST